MLDLALTLFVFLAMAQKNGPMLRTALALLGCLIVDRLHFRVTHEYLPWVWYIATDTITAAIVLARPAGQVQAIIGATYLAEISFHIAYGDYTHRNGYHYQFALCYWQILYAVAILQAVLMGGWTASGLVRFIPRWRALFHRRTSAAAHRSRVG